MLGGILTKGDHPHIKQLAIKMFKFTQTDKGLVLFFFLASQFLN